MVTMTFQGLPLGTTEGELQDFSEDLVHAMARIEGLDLSKDRPRLFFPQSMKIPGLGEEISVFVDGLMVDEAARADSVRKELSRQICWTTKIRFPNATVQCTVRSFDPAAAFCESNGHGPQ